MLEIDDESRWTPADVVGIMSNPFYAIQIDPALAVDHELLLGEDEWIEVNVKLIHDLGMENYLRNLLSILKGNWVAGQGDSYGPGELAEPGDEEDGIVPVGHASIDAAYLDGFVADVICERLAGEPNILARSAAAARRSLGPGGGLREEIEELEADRRVLLEVFTMSPEEWDDLSFGAQRLLLLYFVEKVVVGSPELPLHEQVTVEWRVPFGRGDT